MDLTHIVKKVPANMSLRNCDSGTQNVMKGAVRKKRERGNPKLSVEGAVPLTLDGIWQLCRQNFTLADNTAYRKLRRLRIPYSPSNKRRPRLNAAAGSKITNKRRPRINAAPNQKNAAFVRGL